MATINMNIWLSENNSREPNRGRLIIYIQKANMFNHDPPLSEVISGYKNITIPYKQNWMTMFDSKLFHASNVGRLQPGYKSR